MYRARDEVDQAEWLDLVDEAVVELGLGEKVRAIAMDMFLSALPVADRSKPAVVAASVYAAALIEGEERSQTMVAEAVGVSRLSVHTRWKTVLEEAGFDPPGW